MMKYTLIFVALLLLFISCRSNENSSGQPSSSSEQSGEVVTEVSLETGESVYSNQCAMCHGKEGEGGVGEELADNRDLADTSHVVKRILKGKAPMPPFNHLSDEETASVASFIRSSWGNEFGEVSSTEVAAER